MPNNLTLSVLFNFRAHLGPQLMAVLVFPSTQKNDLKESRFEKCQFNVSFIMNTAGTDDIRELSVTIVVVAGQNDAERQSEWMQWASQYFFAHVIRHYKFHSFGAAGGPVNLNRVDHAGNQYLFSKGTFHEQCSVPFPPVHPS